MEILKILNNNAVISYNENQEEVVVLGSGIAFKKKIGDMISNTAIEKIFYMKKTENKNKFYELISDLPIECLIVTEEIVELAQSRLHKRLDESIFLLLSDHIHYAVERNKEGMIIRNKLIWEIEHFYPLEYQIGLDAVNIINDKLNCQLMHAEAGFIAMHIVNTSSSESLRDFQNEVDDIKAIVKLVTYHFDIKIDEESMNYLRFITHLKFFIQRIRNGQDLNKIEQSDELFSIICKKYFDAFLCVEKIEKYFMNTYDKEISDEEKMYLVLHIERVIHNTNQ